MRRTLGLSLAILVVAIAGGCSDDDDSVFFTPTDVVGSGVIVSENRTVNGFDAVTFASEGSLDVVMGAAETLSIATDDNLMPYLITDVQAGRLSIRTASGVDLMPSGSIQFDLTAASLGEVLYTGVGSVDVSGLNQASFTFTHTGVGTVTLSGTANQPDATISGVGDYDAGSLFSDDVTVHCTGVGTVTVRAANTLDVTLVGGGVVQYIGNPTVTTDITGGGRVEQIPG